MMLLFHNWRASHVSQESTNRSGTRIQHMQRAAITHEPPGLATHFRVYTIDVPMAGQQRGGIPKLQPHALKLVLMHENMYYDCNYMINIFFFLSPADLTES